MKTRNCDICGGSYEKKRMGQKVCSPLCASQLPRVEKAKKQKAENRKRKTQFLQAQVSEWHKTTNTWSSAYWFHRWIRLVRDKDDPCISCDKSDVIQWHAGHYKPAGQGSTRYHEDNVHKQCSQCNSHNSGRIGEYRIRLVAKIGLDRVEGLENNHEIKRWTIEELTAIRDHYKRLCKEEGV
jgi:hypothetical protein